MSASSVLGLSIESHTWDLGTPCELPLCDVCVAAQAARMTMMMLTIIITTNTLRALAVGRHQSINDSSPKGKCCYCPYFSDEGTMHRLVNGITEVAQLGSAWVGI